MKKRQKAKIMLVFVVQELVGGERSPPAPPRCHTQLSASGSSQSLDGVHEPLGFPSIGSVPS